MVGREPTTGQVVVKCQDGGGEDEKGSFHMNSGLGFYSDCGGHSGVQERMATGGLDWVGGPDLRLPLRALQFQRLTTMWQG